MKNNPVVKKHSLLIRQLKRLGISEDLQNINNEQWQTLLLQVSRSYDDSDQERYLLERSMEISAKEMTELNKQLTHKQSKEIDELNNTLAVAQRTAHMGYWSLDKMTDKTVWSPKLFEIFGYDSNNGSPDLNQFMENVHIEDREKLRVAVQEAFTSGKLYEFKIRFIHQKTQLYRWYYVAGGPIYTDESSKVINMLSGIAMDITNRIETETRLVEVNQLLPLVRRAGMAEVATTVLHNVGNVLNSANVSVALAHEILQNSWVKRLEKTAAIFEENSENMTEYLKEDPKGKLFSIYFAQLAKTIQDEFKLLKKENENLSGYITHIKGIVAFQQILSGVAVPSEIASATDLANEALKICGDLNSLGLQVVLNYEKDIPNIKIDKSRLMQVLVNIIQNAKDSILESGKSDKLLDINVSTESENIIYTIKDNGVGIAKNNLTQIFALGYTTKKNGHGFGLHSSAIAINELKGKLIAESLGEGLGAKFIITLPKRANDDK